MTESALKMSEILNKLLKKEGITEAYLGRKLNIPRGTINRLTSGHTPDPRASTVQAIAAYFHICTDQLLGNIPLHLEDDHQLPKIEEPSRSIPLIDWKQGKDWESLLTSLTPQNHANWIVIDKNKDNGKFALLFRGESMWPQFQENTLLIIDPFREAKNGDLVIAYIKENDELLFRRLIIEGKYQLLKAVNAIFPTLSLTASDQIIGTIIQSRNNF